VDEQRVRKHEGERAKERGQPVDRRAVPAQRAQQHNHAETRPVEMQHRQPGQRGVVELRRQQEEDQVGQIEKARLDVADKGRAAVERRVPERQPTLRQLAGSETVGGKEETDQVAAVGGLVDIAAEHPPEEAEGQQE
jgi:hypothetical protein